MATRPAPPDTENHGDPLIPTKALQALLLAGLLTATAIAGAYTLEAFTFEDPAQEAAFHELISELRCLVCQNESLAGSQAELAQDLRQVVYEQLKAGEHKDRIIDFLVARYGDFVLYDPPLKPSTYLLWFGPILLIAAGALVLIRALLRKQQAPDRPLSEQEQRRLQTLLTPGSKPDGPDRDPRP